MSVRQVSFGSPEHERSVDLRRRILRWPLGLDLSPADLEAEKAEIVLISEREGLLVGTLNLIVLADPCGLKMRQVAVEPASQRQGIGRELVLASEALGREMGAGFTKLHAREAALAFYLALGYRLEGEGFEEVGIPHRLMLKNL